MSENNEITENKENSEKEFNLGKEIWEWVYTIVIALVIALLIKAFVFDVVRVDGSSMYPTLVNNDRLIVTKLGYKPHQGDIIILDSRYKAREAVFDEMALAQGKEELSQFTKMRLTFVANLPFHKPSELEKKYYVKRIIGLPGQTIDLRGGKVYVDGEELDEPYYDGETTAIDPTVEFPITVEDDMVFVMGDNRPHSQDSRTSALGQVPIEAILGKSQIRIWPLGDMGITR